MEILPINFDEFELPFATKSTEEEENEKTSVSNSEMEDDEELDVYEAKENMESRIPKEAIFIGGIDSEVENWTTWSIQDEYYIIPVKDNEFNWALFRISWDDNWGIWNWSFDARLSGHRNNPKEAAKYMLLRLWESWELDLNDTYNEKYINLLNSI
jgi:hypothetical protein